MSSPTERQLNIEKTDRKMQAPAESRALVLSREDRTSTPPPTDQ